MWGRPHSRWWTASKQRARAGGRRFRSVLRVTVIRLTNALSSFAGNGLLISPDCLIDEGLLRASDCDEGRSFPKNAVDYDVVIPFKHKLLEKAWTTFSAMPRSALRLDYDQFCVEQAHWLDDYALFRALKARHGGVCYLEWPAELVRREPATPGPSAARPGGTDRAVSLRPVPVVPPGQTAEGICSRQGRAPDR